MSGLSLDNGKIEVRKNRSKISRGREPIRSDYFDGGRGGPFLNQ